MRLTRIRAILAIVALLGASLALAPTTLATGGAPGAVGQHETCMAGDAAKLLEALPVFFDGTNDTPCQYRVFRDGQTFTFCEDDVIVGGIVQLYDYQASGVSRAAAIADLELAVDRVWVDGIEQTLVRTAYKDFMHPAFGLVVYQHRAFLRQLTPGDHVSVWVGTYGPFTDTATVTLHILPLALCG